MEGIMQWLKHRRRSPWILESTESSYRICLFWHVYRKNLASRTVLFNLWNVCFNFKFWRAMVFFSTDNNTIDLSLNQSTCVQIWLHEVAVEGWSHGTLPPQPYPSFLKFKLSSPLLLWEENLPTAIFFNKNFSLVDYMNLKIKFFLPMFSHTLICTLLPYKHLRSLFHVEEVLLVPCSVYKYSMSLKMECPQVLIKIKPVTMENKTVFHFNSRWECVVVKVGSQRGHVWWMSVVRVGMCG